MNSTLNYHLIELEKFAEKIIKQTEDIFTEHATQELSEFLLKNDAGKELLWNVSQLLIRKAAGNYENFEKAYRYNQTLVKKELFFVIKDDKKLSQVIGFRKELENLLEQHFGIQLYTFGKDKSGLDKGISVTLIKE